MCWLHLKTIKGKWFGGNNVIVMFPDNISREGTISGFKLQ